LLSIATKFNDLPMTLDAKIGGLWIFLVILGCETHFKSELHRNQLRYTWRSCVWNFQHWT